MSKLFTLKIQYGKDFVDIDFPCKDGELDEKLKSIGAEKETVHFIKDVQHWDKAMRLLQHRFENLDEVNYLAKRLDSFADEEFRAFYAVISLNSSLTVADLINQTFNMSRVTLIRDVSNLEAVGRNHYMTMHLAAPIEEDNASKMKYEKMGKELLESGKGIATQYGLMFHNEEIEEDIAYNGKTFPPYYCSGDTVVSVALKYEDNEEYVYLPCEDISIEKALKRLGAPSIDDCERSVDWLDISNDELARLFEDYAVNDDLYDLNKLIGKFDGKNCRKLMATIKYINNASLSTVDTALDNLKKFAYIAGAENFYDVGKYAMDDAVGYPIPEELDEYINYDGYGRYIKDTYYGKFVEDGFVYLPNGETLEEILGMEEQSPKMEEM